MFLDMVVEHSQCDIVGTKVTAIDDFLGFQTQWGLVRDLVTEKVAGGDMVEAEFFGNKFGLCAFPAAGSTKKNNIRLHIMCI